MNTILDKHIAEDEREIQRLTKLAERSATMRANDKERMNEL